MTRQLETESLGNSSLVIRAGLFHPGSTGEGRLAQCRRASPESVSVGILTLVLRGISKRPGPQRTSLGQKDLLQSRGVLPPPTDCSEPPRNPRSLEGLKNNTVPSLPSVLNKTITNGGK